MATDCTFNRVDTAPIQDTNFSPEFLNRLDEIIIFNYLNQKQIREIADLELSRVEKRLEKKDITISVSKDVKDFLTEKGYDRNLGARPMKRVIQKNILDPLSLKMVIGEIKPGQRVNVSFEKGKIVFSGSINKKKRVKIR